jgi:hypothetical protein
MRIPAAAYGALVLIVFLGTVGVAMASGAWATSGRTTGGGEEVTLSGETAAEVKGWMTIGDVAEAFDVPLAEILDAFELPADTPPATAVKDLESDLFSVAALREWLEVRTSAGG